LNIVSIQTFLHIVRFGSISEAAKSLFVSQPTVSSRLKQLEEELGFKLVLREKGKRKAEITQKGLSFIPIAESWLELKGKTMSLSSMEEKTVLKVIAPSSTNLHVIHYVFKRLIDNGSLIRPQMMASPSSMIYAAVGSREADLGFAHSVVQYGNTIATPVYDEENILLVSAGDQWPDRAIHPSELDPAKEVAVTSWTGEVRRWHDFWWDPYIAPYVKIESSSGIANFLRGGRVWAICPASVAKSFQEDGRKVELRALEPAPANRVCYQVTNREQGRQIQDAITEFMKAMHSCIADIPWLHRLDG
jgi:DNA-binding transcriptional LysR family regulator